ncbi:MAG TPA: PQQ-binding-like beta-propeller repeat protein [Kofleriaceae bacterium]|nr:PQQ-binding-like beta-propeller repeat protein [Kofleriaceae bacterium]
MRRIAVLFALAACSEPAPKQAPRRNWVYPPAPAAWPLGSVTATIGRSQAPDIALIEGIEAGPNAGPLTPLRMPTPWPVPDGGAAGAHARAVIYGTLGAQHVVELIDIDAGRLLWRDTSACRAPVVAVTAEAVVCADAKGVRAIAIADGKQRWKSDATFIAMTDDRVITAGAGESVIVDANDGGELARVKLPPSVQSDSIIASCGDAGRELFAYGQDGRLVHVIEAKGGPTIQWSLAVESFTTIDACEGPSVIVASGTSLLAVARATGVVSGSIDGVRGYWPARDGSDKLEVSTSTGVALRARDLRGPSESVGLPPLGELLSKRGDMRLVRATPSTAVVLDSKGVRAYLPLAQLGAVLGDNAIIAGSWTGSPGETVRRIAIPDGRYRKRLRLPRVGRGLGVTAELRDLPAAQDIDASGAIAKNDAGKAAVAAVALDPSGAAVYATALDGEPDENSSAGVARFDLGSRTWTWYRADGCGSGAPIALAASNEVIVCGARAGSTTAPARVGGGTAAKGDGGRASVRATTRDGKSAWTWHSDNVDGLDAIRALVLVRDAARVHVLDAAGGHLLGDFESDDGNAMPAAIVSVDFDATSASRGSDATSASRGSDSVSAKHGDSMEMLVVAEHGRVVGRLPRAQMVPAWSIAVNGVVKLIVAAGDGVLVELEDGDAYRIDARTGATMPVAGIGLDWHASDDLLAGDTPGGPVPPQDMLDRVPTSDEPPAAPAPAKKSRKKAGKKDDKPKEVVDESLGIPPRLPPVWPDPGPLPASWQLTIYEPNGAFRARNDYALEAPITPATARSAKAPIVVQSGPELRDILLLDPGTGDPLRRVRLPEDAAPGTAFSTIVDGKAVVGVLLANPLRVVVF